LEEYTVMDSFAVIKRNHDTANKVQWILGLLDDHWTDVQVAFGTDEVATAKVTLLLTGDQLRALAAVAFQRNALHDPD
jgi:hypothetical protein